jgi:hypothetical protein
MMHLNAYDEDRNPQGYDVAVQRISAYIQSNLGPASLQTPPGVLVENPYLDHRTDGDQKAVVDGDNSPLAKFDNGNTIIVFQTSASKKLKDCLVKPRNDMENRWRRLSLHLRKEDTANDTTFSAQCTNLILTDIFHELREIWDFFLARTSDHIAMLEAKIYDNPADESRAPELWTNQAVWLKVEKIMWYQTDVVREMQTLLKELAEGDDQELEVEIDWLAGTTAEYERLTHDISEALVQPTRELSELMYRSVAIRDSRQSLQLGLSMWRLSWITFIFLPLTFSVSFFGMNVDLFENFPSIGWYFLAAGVLMMLGKLTCRPSMDLSRSVNLSSFQSSCYGSPSNIRSNGHARHLINGASTSASSNTSKTSTPTSGQAKAQSPTSNPTHPSDAGNGRSSSAGSHPRRPSTKPSTDPSPRAAPRMT